MSDRLERYVTLAEQMQEQLVVDSLEDNPKQFLLTYTPPDHIKDTALKTFDSLEELKKWIEAESVKPNWGQWFEPSVIMDLDTNKTYTWSLVVDKTLFPNSYEFKWEGI